MSRLLALVLVPALAFAGTGQAGAELVTVTLGDATFSARADTVTLTTRTFALDLAADVPVTTLLQSGQFTVGFDPDVTQTVAGTLSRAVTTVGGTGALSQPLNVAITPVRDTMTILPGPTTLLHLGGLRQLEIAPLGTTVSRTTLGTSLFDLQGTFRLIVVPESSVLVLSVLGVLGLLGYRRRQRS
jgi:hypothetical protein